LGWGFDAIRDFMVSGDFGGVGVGEEGWKFRIYFNKILIGYL
jgi:hypothetical protein